MRNTDTFPLQSSFLYTIKCICGKRKVRLDVTSLLCGSTVTTNVQNNTITGIISERFGEEAGFIEEQ